MNNSLYSKKVICPICSNQFSSMKVKVGSCKVEKRDADFCTHYEGLNPLYYEIFVCPVCAYSATENSFEEINEKEIAVLKEAFAGRSVGRNFCNERSLNDAIDSCKLAIYTAELRESNASTFGGLCLKLAWLYRFAEDKQEERFLNYSLKYYLEAFNQEKFPFGNLNEISVQYLLGELSRRLGKYEDAIVWFGKVIGSPEREENPRIEKLTREQWILAKDQYKKNGKTI